MLKINYICLILVGLYSTGVNAASFDCSKASNAVEREVCNNEELSTLDEKLSKAYKAAINQSTQQDAVKATQRLWIKERNQCASDAMCLKNAYISRINALENNQAEPEMIAKTDTPKDPVVTTEALVNQEPQTSVDPLTEMLAKQQAQIDASKYLNLQCIEGSKNGAFPTHPFSFLIRHLTDKSATIVFYVGGAELDEAHIMKNQSFKTSETQLIYDSSDYQRFKSRSIVKYEITQFYIDRVNGTLHIGDKSRNPTYDPKRGGMEFYQYFSSYPCKKVSDQRFNKFEKDVIAAKKQKAEQQKIIDKANSEKVKKDRKF